MLLDPANVDAFDLTNTNWADFSPGQLCRPDTQLTGTQLARNFAVRVIDA